MMIPDNFTAEQNQVKRIVKRWSRIENFMLSLSKNAVLIILLWIGISHQKGNLGRSICLTALVGGLSIYLYNRLSRFAIQRFASRLTEEEKTLLRNAIIDTTIEDNQTIKDLLIASQKKGTQGIDLLRASQSPNDDTLLRPTTQPEHTPTEQLLRAVPPEENERIGA
jgi:hypothetical protein